MAAVKRKMLLLIIGILITWACVEVRYFDLQTENQGDLGSIKLDKVLLIEDVEINETYRDHRIVCRDSPFQVKYCHSSLWSKSPDELIEDAVTLFWKRRAVFKKVNSYPHEDDPDLTMRIRVEAIEKCLFQKKWHARLALDMEISYSRNNEILLLHSFDQKTILPGNKNDSLPETIVKILHAELAKIEEKLLKKYSEK